MLIAEAEAFVREQIIPRWPRWKRSGVEVSDFIRQLKKLDSDTALEAIIRTKEQGKTYTWPDLVEFRKQISLVIKENHTFTTQQDKPCKWVDCYALDEETGKYILLCQSSALSEEGLKAGFALYLKHWGFEPTDYTFFLGDENYRTFFDRRHEALSRLSPKIATRVAAMQEVGGVDDIPF